MPGEWVSGKQLRVAAVGSGPFRAQAVIALDINGISDGRSGVEATLQINPALYRAAAAAAARAGVALDHFVEAQRKTMSAQARIGIAGYQGPRLELDVLDPARFATRS